MLWVFLHDNDIIFRHRQKISYICQSELLCLGFIFIPSPFLTSLSPHVVIDCFYRCCFQSKSIGESIRATL